MAEFKKYFCYVWLLMRRTTQDSKDQIKEFRNSLLVSILTVVFVVYVLRENIDRQNVINGLIGVTALIIIFLLINFFASPYKIYAEQKEKLTLFEKEAIPKLEINAPINIVEPKGSTGKAFRTWRILVNNTSTTTIKKCCVKKKNLMNKSGHLSDVPGLPFKLTTDQPIHLGDFEYQKEFDLSPRTSQYVDITCLDENDTSINARVWMLYAIPNSNKSSVRAGLPFNEFPHTLTIEVSAENIIDPIEITYKLDINDSGFLQMDRID